jgi:nitrogen fixation NifU-like protein
VILDHNRRPRNFRAIVSPSHHAEGYNPLCGDRLNLYVQVDGDVITDVAFQGSGCAISKASASLMTAAVRGTTRADADALFERVHRLVTGRLSADEARALGRLAALGGVSAFPIRVKCASLSWHALHAALAGAGESVTTE